MNALTGAAQQSLDTWTDLSGFDSLRATAQKDAKAALPAVARQFEAIFTQMMLKSMRQASFGDGLFDSQGTEAYRSLYDQQLSLSLSNSGHGLGIADMLIRQLGGHETPNAHGTAGSIMPAVAPTTADHPNARSQDGSGAASLLDGVLKGATAAAGALTASSPVEFVKAVAPYARAAARRLGVSVRAVLAQAALETGWGKHTPTAGNGTPSHNLFGIKSTGHWQGDSVKVPTLEYQDGIAVRRQDSFRAYASPAQSFADYASLLSESPRYAAVKGHGDDVAGFAHALVDAGYATDPAYASKLTAVADSDTMREALASLKSGATSPMQGP